MNIITARGCMVLLSEDGTLELVHTGEGRVVKSGSVFRYDYVLKDHLGNVRVGFEGTSGSTATTPNFTADYS